MRKSKVKGRVHDRGYAEGNERERYLLSINIFVPKLLYYRVVARTENSGDEETVHAISDGGKEQSLMTCYYRVRIWHTNTKRINRRESIYSFHITISINLSSTHTQRKTIKHSLIMPA